RNVARTVHHVYADPEDESGDTRLFFTSKANHLARPPATLRFTIQSACQCEDPGECGHIGRLVWDEDPVDLRTADEIWKQIAEANRPRRDVAVQEAEKFLQGLM